MNIHTSSAAYGRWLRRWFEPLPADLAEKHALMRQDRFTFFRATFFRWAQLWEELPRAVRRAPVVLAVGDAHVENFGTWRDAEGRLVWATNDFDEAAERPIRTILFDLPPAQSWRMRRASSASPPRESARPFCWAT